MVHFLMENLQCVRKGLPQRIKLTDMAMHMAMCSVIKLNVQAPEALSNVLHLESEINTGWRRGAGNTPKKIKTPVTWPSLGGWVGLALLWIWIFS